MTAPLAESQAWFLAAIMTPGGAARGLALAQARHGLAEHEVLRPAPGLPASRLHVYADGYVLRLLECMRADFPVLHRVMGGALFDFFAKAYVWRHPSRSPTLYDLGAGFAGFLAASQPATRDPEATRRFAFPAQLARLERALGEAGRARGLEGAAPADRPGMLDWLCRPDARVTPAQCTRLLALDYPVHAYWQAAARARDDADLPLPPAPAPTRLAVGRLHYRTAVHVLEPWQFHFLQAAQEGAPAHACALHAATACALAPERVLADALLWVPLAAGAGLVAVG
ncbi:DNA-binding domain-containing protein [uncultured Massilia sp.]|uniref:HvfC/BufC N-terminal domain-containing protein n=1 Tax=uncultured Massilia sp. TaxID=169973 RepID=UPI0025F90C0D|nr:DNA-binding domain-containing protein [uncultured Massilia sp.]